MAEHPKAPPRIASDLLRGNGVIGLGDSITAADLAYTPTSVAPGSRSWLVRMCMASGGRIRLIRNAGVSGDQTSQMLTRMNADVLAYRPHACTVLGGINDITHSVSAATTHANLTAIYQRLRAADIEPIPCLLVPNGTVVSNVLVERLNYWIRNYCETHGLRYIDFPAVTVERNATSPQFGLWIAGYNDDLTHPGTVGTLAMANKAVTDIGDRFPHASSPLETYNTTDYSGLNLLKDGLFATDVSLDGVADVWTKGGGATWNSGVTPSLISGDAAIHGNWQEVAWTTAASRYLAQDVNPAGWAVGETLRFCGRFSTSNSAGGLSINIGIEFLGSGANVYPVYGFVGVDVTNWVFDIEAVIPAGTTTPEVRAVCGGNAGTARFAQFTVINKTRLGLV